MRKIFYSLILFVSLFIGLNYASAYTLQEGEEILLKCNYGLNVNEDPIFSVIKTNQRFIIDGPYNKICKSSTVSIQTLIGPDNNKVEVFQTPPANTREDALKNYCPAVMYLLGEEDGICKFSNVSDGGATVDYGVISGELGDIVKEEPVEEQKICSFEVNVSQGDPLKLIVKKQYGQYYYKYRGYNVDSGDIILDEYNEYSLKYYNTNIKLNISEQLVEDIKEMLDSIDSSDECPVENFYQVCQEEIGFSDVGDERFTISEPRNYCPTTYSRLLGDLKNPLAALSKEALSYSLLFRGQTITLNFIDANDTICAYGKCENPQAQTIQALRNIRSYCNEVYVHVGNNFYRDKLDECIAFEKFYDALVESQLIEDLTSGCDFVTNELMDKLIWILDLLKIAGPILALGLGTLDFIKVLASGDADKEMKKAFKNFGIRILAAILLFVIPVILAFLMEVFIGNQDGYDPDNPFCNVVQWDD